MISPRFCNYNLDYQQRLGFLKLLVRVSERVRGGPEAFEQKLEMLYRGSVGNRNTRGGAAARFDPIPLLERDEIPSWQPGFSKDRLDRLVLWAQMVGLIATNGGLSEWARILQQVSLFDSSPERDQNPFLLSPAERAFFVHLLFYHDQVLPVLVAALGELAVHTRIGVREACLLIVECLGAFYESTSGTGVDQFQLRGQLKNLLERMATQYGLHDTRLFLISEKRRATIHALRTVRKKNLRVHLAEYHAICRFEQLTDMGLLSKDPPSQTSDKRVVRRAWEWYTTPALIAAARFVRPTADCEEFLERRWMQFSSAMLGEKIFRKPLWDAQVEIGALLDQTFPLVRRQFGPVQVHSWAVLACLQALRKGVLIEIGDVHDLLDAMRAVPSASTVIRQGGRAQLLARTATILGTISQFVLESPVQKGKTN